MSILKKYWALLLAILLFLGAAWCYANNYTQEKAAYEAETQQLETMIRAIQESIQNNARYTDVQDQLEGRMAQIEESRQALYEHFPKEMKEEDQIMYVLYLEKLFGTEISFAFASPVAVVPLQDGSTLLGLDLTVNYETTYQGFQDMIAYLSTDSRITSVKSAALEYDAKKDLAIGALNLRLYLLDAEVLEYLPPDVAEPDTGKDNIFD